MQEADAGKPVYRRQIPSVIYDLTSAAPADVGSLADSQSTGVFGLLTRAFTSRFNGTTWDRERGNHEITVLSAANRTASTNSADQTNHNQHGAFIHMDVATDPGGGETLQLLIQFKEDSISNNYVQVLDDGANATPGERSVLLGNGLGAAGNDIDTVVAYNLPRNWRVRVVHSAAGTWNYSVVVSYIN